MTKFKYWMLACLMASAMAHAGPQLDVGALHDYLEPGKSTYAKRIYNKGDSTAFVKVSVLELVYGKDGKPVEVDVEQLPLEQRAVVASPARLIIPARGMQAVRLLYRGERGKERYFRLRFIPVVPERDDSFALSEKELSSYRQALSAGVQLLAGYGTVMFIKPDNSQYQTTVRQVNGTLHVRNEGNATAILDNFQHCRVGTGECDNPIKHHLRPGTSREFAEKTGSEYRFELREGASQQAMTFKAN